MKLMTKKINIKITIEETAERHPVPVLGTDYKVKIIYKNIKVAELDVEDKILDMLENNNINTLGILCGKTKSDLKKIERILRKQSLRDLLLFTIGTNCGLRISDSLSLNVGDVRGKNYINIIEKKTGKFKRFPINSKLKPLFDKFTAKRNSDEPLFLSVFNNRMERTQSYRIIRDACREVGIDYKIGTHTLRKTFGYHHYKKFKDVALLQKIFNHSSPAITLRYIGIDQEEIDESYNNFIL